MENILKGLCDNSVVLEKVRGKGIDIKSLVRLKGVFSNILSGDGESDEESNEGQTG